MLPSSLEVAGIVSLIMLLLLTFDKYQLLAKHNRLGGARSRRGGLLMT